MIMAMTNSITMTNYGRTAQTTCHNKGLHNDIDNDNHNNDNDNDNDSDNGSSNAGRTAAQ